MKKLILILIINYTLLTSIGFAQQIVIDSLKQVIVTAEQDTNRIRTYLELGILLESTNADTALLYYKKALKIAKDNNKQKLTAKCYRTIGIVYYYQGNYNKTIENWEKALKINEIIGNKDGISSNLGNIGVVYIEQGKYKEALENYHKAIEIDEESENIDGVAYNLTNIGTIYQKQNNYEKALEYYHKALTKFEIIDDKSGAATNLGNIGIVYKKQSKSKINSIIKRDSLLNLALEYYNKAIKVFKEIDDKIGVARNLGNIGNVYSKQNNYKKALEYDLKALKIYEEIENKRGVLINLGSIGDAYNGLKQYDKALHYTYRSLEIAKEIGVIDFEKSAYSILSKSYKELKNYEKALEYTNLWIAINDSMFNTEKSKAIADINTRYETEKKEKQIIKQQAELKTSQLETEKQQTQRNMFIIAFILMLMLALIVFWSYKQKRKANNLLAEQKDEILEKNEELNQQNEEILTQSEEIISQRDVLINQKEEIEEIHFKISESIDYATRLQQSILPETKLLDRYLSEHFVLFKPKDKVSGDFYWWAHTEKQTVITAADSTGHGVPGAFMSMLGSSLLREIVQKEYITHTGVILRKLRKEIIKALKQTGEVGTQKDGMDMAIISINHETNVVQYSGANNPLYIITNYELQISNESSYAVKLCDNSKVNIQKSKLFYEIKPDKMPISIYKKMNKFTTHEIQLQKGDQLYLFSDGYPDQFGGLKGKKFKYKPFKRMLLENADKPMVEQKEILNTAFETWRGDLEQIDDVVVLGIKI